jgi:hypothetical protein
MNPLPMSEELGDLIISHLKKTGVKTPPTRRWHEYEEDEQLPPLDKIFSQRLILDSKVEDNGGPWYTVTHKKKKY